MKTTLSIRHPDPASAGEGSSSTLAIEHILGFFASLRMMVSEFFAPSVPFVATAPAAHLSVYSVVKN